jgi:hypothetical protein
MSLRDKGSAKQWKVIHVQILAALDEECLPYKPTLSFQKMLPPFEVLGYLSGHENGAEG